jgi:hypothetical protein
MALEVSGYDDVQDWHKMGPSLLIATCLILAIRTAKWPSRFNEHTSDMELQREIDYASHLAGRVLSTLKTRKPDLFPQKKRAWYKPDEEDVPK